MEIETIPTVIKKKRGRKPKNTLEENIVFEKKKRGRKKKYEIENFDKIVNRNDLNNFNHDIVYSSDEEIPVQNEQEDTKKISFGNLNITVSKKQTSETNENTFKGLLKETIPLTCAQTIDEDEFDSDEEKELPIENIISNNEERVYKENKKYVTDFTESIKEQSVKRLRVVTCCKDIVNDNEWPKSTDSHCWWCCHRFECTPCTLPTRYDQLRKRFTFMGIFCSWNCSKSYNFNTSDHRKYERSSLISFLVQQLYGIEHAINIKPAPPRETLKMFGGYLDISDFRSRYQLIDSYHINLQKHNFIFPEISEVTNVKIKQSNNVNKKNLRLQRV
jgi:hypothetical protein